LGVAPDAWHWREGPHGRPEIDRPSTDLHFNLSHSASVVACVLGRGQALGVDVEHLERRAPDRAIVPRYCSPTERADVESRGADWCERFLTYWTLKEAYLKARGLGIAVPLSDVSFDLSGEEPRIRFEGSLAGTDARWAFHLWRPTPTHVAALAVHVPGRSRPRVEIAAYD
jgi:4'-phosphopantetheinyl transferase